MPFTSSLTGSFTGGRRASTDSFAGLAKSNRIIVHYDPSDNTSYDGSSTTLTDLTSNSYNGTIVSSPTFETDHFNYGDGDYFVTPDIGSSITSDVHTVEMWVYPTDNDGCLAVYLDDTDPDTNYRFSAIEMVSGQLEFGLWNGSSLVSSGPTGSVSLNAWHQVVLSYDGSHIRGFVDGVRVCKTAVTFSNPTGGVGGGWHIAVGPGCVTNQGSGGDLRDWSVGIFRVYDAKLNRSAIRRNYNTDKDTHTAPSSAWDPSTDITTRFHIDASDTSSYSLSGSDLSSVTDKAGNFTITVDGTPTRVSSALNSLNVWDFNGSESLITSDEQAVSDGSGNHWAIGVFLADTIDDTQDSFYSFENNTVAASSKRDYAVSSGNASAFNGELDLDGLASNRISTTIGNKQDFDSGVSLDAFHIVGTIFNTTGNQISVRVDGANAFTPVNDYNNSINQNQDIRIMRNRANERMDGRVAEFFVVGALPGTGGTDITEFEKAEGYLAHKWGLTGNLPSDHPFKNVSP